MLVVIDTQFLGTELFHVICSSRTDPSNDITARSNYCCGSSDQLWTLHRIVIMNATPDPATPVLTTSEAPTTPPTPSTSTSQVLTKPGVSYGRLIEGIAIEYSLHPFDVAIGICGVLTNIAGPYAGLVDSGGGRVKPHLSLLRIGSTTSRLHRLERRLFHPLRTRANWLRQSASSHSRRLADSWTFCGGTAPSEGKKHGEFPDFFRQRRDKANEQQEMLFRDHGLHPQLFNEMSLTGAPMFLGQGGNPVRNSPGRFTCRLCSLKGPLWTSWPWP